MPFVSHENEPHVNREETKSHSACRAAGGKPVRVRRPDVHSQAIVPLFSKKQALQSVVLRLMYFL
jgi:hypothetical protein